MNSERKFGTAPVFFTAIATILGAILFLRFGFAVGSLGLGGVLLIVILGHMVTIPTSLAISELATNKRVEGGGEYYIISRSFGLNIGATIGIALYLSQAISVAFYVIAFTEVFDFFFRFVFSNFNMELPRQFVSVPIMFFLSILILKKGANLGVKALYFVVAILAASLVLFFLGDSPHADNQNVVSMFSEMKNMDQFFIVFAIVFPAFTGMTAGVGLSGDLKRPGKSIPIGTVTATFAGMIIYVFIAYKFQISTDVENMINNQFVMTDIALWGFIVVPLGLAASTLSSALGSVMVAPRTLQALAIDQSFPSKRLNRWLGKGREKDNEPVSASLITCIIAMVFVVLGDVNVVAQIISMFFLVTYGSLCLISFLNHFGSSPSYRPSFKSRWYLSLIGFLTAIWVMFKISSLYTVFAFSMITLLYLYINHYHKNRKGLASIFANAIFQLNRRLQVYLQKQRMGKTENEWRPSAICISKNFFRRSTAYKLLDWISYKYGFGTYVHRIEGYYSKETYEQSLQEMAHILKSAGRSNHVYVDTLISPSNTASIAQSIQMPGIAGMENNMVIFDFDKEDPKELDIIVDNFQLVHSGNFDICLLGTSKQPVVCKNGIHVWIKTTDVVNSNLMILLSFIIKGHPDWKKGRIKIFNVCREGDMNQVKLQMDDLLKSGRLPITSRNIEVIVHDIDVPVKEIINKYSADAGLTLIGFREERLRHQGVNLFKGYDSLGNILFVNSFNQKTIE